MAKFRKEGKGETPPVSTASLPDIVFMLLFFFMVTTVMREVELKVQVSQPEAVEVAKLENRAQIIHMYIGPPVSKQLGDVPRIQLADDFASLEEVGAIVESIRKQKPEPIQGKLTTSLKIDKDAKMGLVTDVKQELRKVYALKINYSTHEGTR